MWSEGKGGKNYCWLDITRWDVKIFIIDYTHCVYCYNSIVYIYKKKETISNHVWNLINNCFDAGQ